MNANNSISILNTPAPQEPAGPAPVHRQSSASAVERDHGNNSDDNGAKPFDKVLHDQTQNHQQNKTRNGQKNDSERSEGVAAKDNRSSNDPSEGEHSTAVRKDESTDQNKELADKLSQQDSDIDENTILANPTALTSDAETETKTIVTMKQALDAEAARSDIPSTAITTDQATKTALAAQAAVNGQINNPATINNSSPVAGSQVAPSSADLQKNLQSSPGVDFEKAESTQAHSSGKFIPPSGKKSPESLPFYSSVEVASKTTTSNKVDTASPVPANITELMNKSVNFSQQLNALEPVSVQPQPSASTLSADATNLLNLVNSSSQLNPTGSAEKLSDSRMPAPYSINIAAPAGSDEWNNQVGNKIRWLGKINIGTAELQLHPAELGSIEVKISTENDQTRINFLSNNAATRDILEASLPKLRELLADSGLQLEHSDVSAQSQESNGQTDNHGGDSNNDDSNLNNIDGAEQNHRQVIRDISLGQVDHYV